LEKIINVSNMKRKVKTLAEETRKQVEKLKEIEELLKLAQQEELDKIESVTKQIETICSTGDVFCGVILTVEDLLSVIRMAIQSKESVKIPFRIYINEDNQ
jgi:hypothetical protein